MYLEALREGDVSTSVARVACAQAPAIHLGKGLTDSVVFLRDWYSGRELGEDGLNALGSEVLRALRWPIKLLSRRFT